MKKMNLIRSLQLAGAIICGLSFASGPAGAASMSDAALEKRVSDLEREVALIKNRLKSAKDCDCDRIVRSGNSRVKVKLYGQVNRAVRFSVGRKNWEIQHVDNDTEESKIGIEAEARLTPDLTIIATIEAQWTENGRSGTDATNDGNLVVAAGAMDIALAHDTLGKLYLGFGDPASVDTTAQDFSGTDMVFGSGGCSDDGGLRFGPPNGNQSGGLTLGGACSNFEGDTESRIMYESPEFLDGFVFKVSHGSQNKFEAGLFYTGNLLSKDLKVAGAVGFQYSPGQGSSSPLNTGRGNANAYTGSVAILHDPTGLSIQFAGGVNATHASRGPTRGAFYYVKGGWQGAIWSVGKTFASIDFGQYDHVTPDVHAYAIGFALVQEIKDESLSVYAGVRYQDAKQGGVGQQSLFAVIAGIRLQLGTE